MNTLTATGNAALDRVLPLLTEQNIVDLVRYAEFLRWSAVNSYDDDDDDDGSWADLPLTPEEEEGLRRGRENAKNGRYLTLAQFKERMSCGQ
ncbi:MAG: hypothetical protein IJP53_05300 [Synergistaceae bacterium]|nr:hypothetical protein [Synergistaceae bacterium]MBR0095471.1 hypothetical protein [Synergistaceae bacterium]